MDAIEEAIRKNFQQTSVWGQMDLHASLPKHLKKN